MADRLWLHIGSPKTGTTALQHFCNDHRAELAERGVLYVAPEKWSNLNRFSNSMNRGVTDFKPRLRKILIRQYQAHPGIAVASSEQLFHGSPENILKFLEVDPGQLTVVMYLRRQDTFLESIFIQKRKTGRFTQTIGEFARRTAAYMGRYMTIAERWAATGATVVPRLGERSELVGGSTVTDFLSLLGIEPFGAIPESSNSSPDMLRVQMLDALRVAGFKDNLPYIQRNLGPSNGRKAVYLNHDERSAYFARFAEENERLRAAYFPDRDLLFDPPEATAEPAETEAFSQAQFDEVCQVLTRLKELRQI